MNPLNCLPTRAVVALVIGAALVASPVALGQGKDDQWEITSKMEMPGMPMAMPAQVVRICVAKNGKDEDFVPKQNNCRMVDSKRAANKFTYRMECTGDDPSTMDGEVTFGTGAYEGKMKMTMTKTKQSMQMTYAGQRVGACTAPTK
jgi:Protein of unknown function (DUF3617)